MKKTYKYLSTSFLAAAILVSASTIISAATESFTNRSVPTAQGYSYLSGRNTSTPASYSTVNLSKMSPDAVTFSSGKNYESEAIVYSTGVTYKMSYSYCYIQGAMSKARYRNHNWSLNSNTISGVVNYN